MLQRANGRRVASAVVAVATIAIAVGWAGAAAGAEPRSLGAVVVGQPVTSGCPAGSLCHDVVVTCPGVQQHITATVSVAQPVGARRGVGVFLTGSGGTTWYTDASTRSGRNSAAMLTDLRRAGFVTVEVRWRSGWFTSAVGEDAGTEALACRPATLVDWVHRVHYAPLGLDPAVGHCGFCLTGNSGGATAITYALSHYGLDHLVDALVPTGGPPHADPAKGCLGDGAFTYSSGARRNLDRARGFDGQAGPCSVGNAAYASRWLAEGVATGGTDHHHPTTRVELVTGQNDEPYIHAHVDAYEERLLAAGSPMVTSRIVPATGHDVNASTQGADLVEAALLATPAAPATTTTTGLLPGAGPVAAPRHASPAGETTATPASGTALPW